MYYIGICDDEPIFLKNITEMTEEILDEAGISYDIRTFDSMAALADYMNTSGVTMNLLLLDILMKGQSGIEFAMQLRHSGNTVPVIFVTTTMDFALDGYRVESVGYLLKPVVKSELKEALLRAYRSHIKQTVILNSSARSVSFRLDEVLYLDIHDKKLDIHMVDGSVQTISIPLNSLISKLPKEQFIRCYRSYIVSLPAIISIWKYGIELKNHETIPVSRTYYSAVQNALMNWVSLT